MKTIQQVYREQIDMFTHNVKEMIKNRFEEDKFIAPVAMALILKDDKLIMTILGGLAELFVSDEGKERAAQIMKQLNKQIKPIAFAFASEAYVSLYETDKKDMSEIVDENGNIKVRPSEDPNRKEVVVISFETHDQKMVNLYEINRTKEEPFLVELEINNNWVNKEEEVLQGRMDNLLQENYSELAEILKKQLGYQLN